MSSSWKTREWKSAAAKRVMKAAGENDIDCALDKIALKLLDGVACPPTDLGALLERLNVCRVESDGEIMVTGALKKEGRRLVIQVFPGLSSGRRRFTIAHELGHAFMETTGAHPPRSGKELEEICDRFAAEILMPRRAFVGNVGRSPNISAVLEAGYTFRTSRTAAFRRVRDLYRMKCCEFEDGSFNWSYGFGNVERSNLGYILERKFENEGTERIDLYFGRGFASWHMEWRRMEGGSRMICLLRPG